jgi:hypothetical protein
MQLGSPATAVRAHEELFAYWASRRDHGRLPGRSHIAPDHFKRHLPNISLIDVSRDERGGGRIYRQRLAGTDLYSVYGREITGRTLEEIYSAPAAEYWRLELDKVCELRKPGVGFHNLAWRGQSHLSILWLRLPLSTSGGEVDMIMGYDALVGMAESAPSGIRAA